MKFQEASLENLVIENLRDINYEYIHGSNLERDPKDVLLLDKLHEALNKINKDLSESTIKEAIRKIRTFETNDVFTNNKLFHKYLTEGVEVTDFINGETVYSTVKLIDYKEPEKNSDGDWGFSFTDKNGDLAGSYIVTSDGSVTKYDENGEEE